jgi:hypothetical protein
MDPWGSLGSPWPRNRGLSHRQAEHEEICIRWAEKEQERQCLSQIATALNDARQEVRFFELIRNDNRLVEKTEAHILVGLLLLYALR